MSLVTIRPGRYAAAVLQRPNGNSRQGPWTREGAQPCPIFWMLHSDERLAYIIRCTLPDRPASTTPPVDA